MIILPERELYEDKDIVCRDRRKSENKYTNSV